jgi:hypothetical protein
MVRGDSVGMNLKRAVSHKKNFMIDDGDSACHFKGIGDVDFWMDAFSKKESAVKLCEVMGWIPEVGVDL